MPRSARVLAVSGALVVAGVLVGGTAYAAARAQPDDETYVACVTIATGAMRLIDPLAGQACATAAGPGQEREISWARTAGSRGPQGPAGPHGPRGPAGEDGEDGEDGGGTLRSLDDLAGVRCTSGDRSGRVEITVQPPQHGSAIHLTCMTDDTVTTTRTPPPQPEPPQPEPPRPTRTVPPPPTTEYPEPTGHPEPTSPPTEDPDPGGEPDHPEPPSDGPAGDAGGQPAG